MAVSESMIVEGVVEQEGQKGVLDGEPVARTEIPIVEDLEKLLINEVAQGREIGVGVDSDPPPTAAVPDTRTPTGRRPAILRHRGRAPQIGNDKTQFASFIAPGQGQHTQM